MWRITRYCKALSLLAFLLPWLTVSCSKAQIASPSGFNLMTGDFSVSNPMGEAQAVSGPPSVLLMAAFMVILMGGLFSLFNRDNEIERDDETAPRVVLGTSVISLLLVFFATISVTGSTIAAQASKQSGDLSRQIAGSLISVDYAFGYWIEILSLLFAAIISASIVFGKPMNPQLVTSLFAPGNIDKYSDDLAFWDKMADKSDPDILQEYLIRYPQGRFVELAHLKLTRMGVEPLANGHSEAAAGKPSILTEPAPSASIRTCPGCGTRYGGQVEFCTRDGSSLIP